MYSSLYIKHSTVNDAGTYLCKFGHLHDKIHVDVLLGDSKQKEKSSGKILTIF